MGEGTPDSELVTKQRVGMGPKQSLSLPGELSFLDSLKSAATSICCSRR